jgi:hypothetical protein
MNHQPAHPQNTRPQNGQTETVRPPVTRWNLPSPRLQGVRFIGPVSKVTTVDSPLRRNKSE